MTENESAAFARVRDIIAEFSGVGRVRISLDSDLCRDLGVAGDDGDDLFRAFDDAFDVDWSGLDLGVHFGNEGQGYPLPCQMKNNCLMYKTQPCKVADVVQAVETGRWHGSRLIFRPKSEREKLFARSVLQLIISFGVLVISFATIIYAFIG